MITLAAAILLPIDYLLRRNVGHCNEKDRKSGSERARIKGVTYYSTVPQGAIFFLFLQLTSH
jgi:hypothetical protein